MTDVDMRGKAMGATGGSRYIAVAFAFSPQMKDADLYYCDGSNVTSGAIQAQYSPPVVDSSLPVVQCYTGYKL